MRRWSTQWIRGALLPSFLLLTPTEPTTTPTAELDVAVGGCFEWLDAACVLRERDTDVTLWLDTDAESVPVVRIDETEVETEAVAIAGGVRISVDVPVTATALSVQLGEASVRLPLQRLVASPEEEAFLALRRAKDNAGALKSLEESLQTTEGFTRIRLLDIARRVDNGMRRYEREQERTLEQIELAREVGAPMAEMHALSSLANLRANELRNPGAVAPLLERLLELGEQIPEALVRRHYYTAVAARKIGDLGGALHHLEQAERGAARLGLDKLLIDSYDWHGSILAELGRGQEAIELASRGLELAPDEAWCSIRHRLLANFGWSHLVLATADLPHDDPHGYFEEAIALLEQCPNPSRHASRLVDLALTELTYDEPNEALAWLSQLETEPAGLAPWIEEARARAAEDAGRWSLVPSLLHVPIASEDPQLRWASLVRQAQTEHRWGFSEVAAETFAKAEAVLDTELNGVSVGSGADLYLAGRSASAQGLVDVLLEEGRTEEALCRARLARRRSLARLDRVARVGAASPEVRGQWEAAVSEIRAERDTIEAERAKLWELRVDEQERVRAKLEVRAQDVDVQLDFAVRKLGVRATTQSCEDLAQPEPGVLWLVIAELPQQWVVFAATEDGVEARRMSWTELFDPGGDWLASFGSKLDAATRVVVVPTGASWGIPIHARPVGDDTLIDRVPVAYSLDLPPRPPAATEPTALVVADPTGNLPQAVAESHDVARVLSSVGWRVLEQTGAEATRAAVTEALANVSLFHYAGHGRADGVVGWNSALTLHGAEDLSVDDILALSSVPSGVVLTGCETGAVSLETVAGGMNLGRAFVLAGAQWVVAADVRVSDELAREVGTRLYAEAKSETLDGAAALQRALVELKDHEGWEAFRVVVP